MREVHGNGVTLRHVATTGILDASGLLGWGRSSFGHYIVGSPASSESWPDEEHELPLSSAESIGLLWIPRRVCISVYGAANITRFGNGS